MINSVTRGYFVVDINECEQAQYPCRGNSQCVNLPGSFRCQQCPRGQIANLDARRCEGEDASDSQSVMPCVLNFLKGGTTPLPKLATHSNWKSSWNELDRVGIELA